MCAASQTRTKGIPKSNTRVAMIKNTLKSRKENRPFSETFMNSLKIMTGRDKNE
tara:strand:- start:3058 stop:3219 length:162 start_codon:yes stop_codon:yes gene_type:complete